jgi:hypothetical protein
LGLAMATASMVVLIERAFRGPDRAAAGNVGLVAGRQESVLGGSKRGAAERAQALRRFHPGCGRRRAALGLGIGAEMRLSLVQQLPPMVRMDNPVPHDIVKAPVGQLGVKSVPDNGERRRGTNVGSLAQLPDQ